MQLYIEKKWISSSPIILHLLLFFNFIPPSCNSRNDDHVKFLFQHFIFDKKHQIILLTIPFIVQYMVINRTFCNWLFITQELGTLLGYHGPGDM